MNRVYKEIDRYYCDTCGYKERPVNAGEPDAIDCPSCFGFLRRSRQDPVNLGPHLQLSLFGAPTDVY